MGLMNRLSLVFRAKANTALDKAEDPRETLDLSYEDMQKLLRQAKGGIADVATAKKRIEMQATDLKAKSDKLHTQAQAALQQGNEGLAQEALTRRAAIVEQITALQPSFEKMEDREQKLIANKNALETKIQAFAREKEVLKASYTAAEAQTKVNEALAGIGESMSDVGVALQRARDKTEQAEARAAGLDALIEQGALTDLTGSDVDDIDRQLNAASANSQVTNELEAMKRELAAKNGPAGELKSGDETK